MSPWLISRAVAARVLVLAVALALVALGAYQAQSARTEVLPEFSPPYVEVQTEALGLSAEEVEQLITAPMENLLLNGVAFLDGIRSESVNGLSCITLIFEPGTDLLEARQVVQERLTQAGLLAHLTDPPAIVQPLSSSSRVLVVGFRSADVSPIEMSVLARWTIRPRLLGVTGVANVSIFGQRERQLQVQVDPRRLARRGVTLQEVINTSGNALWVSPLTYLQASAPGTGGFVDTPTSRLEIRHVSPITTAGDLSKVALERADGARDPRGMTLGDVAHVTEDHQPLIGDAVVDDGPGLVLVIEKLPGANTVEVTEGIEEALATLAPGLEGITVDTELFRPASFVEAARTNYVVTLGVGLALAALLVLLVLLHLRATLVALVSTLVSLATSVLVLELLGIGLDGLALAGLALAAALVVHDAVGTAEHLLRGLRDRGDDTASALSRVTLASVEARRSAGYATAVALVALWPLLAVDRLAQAFYRPALVAFAVVLLVSLLVSLTVTPALASVVLHRTGDRRSPVTEAVRRAATGVSERLAGAWRLAAAVLAVGVIATTAATAFVQSTDRPALLPEFQESDLVVSWQGEPGVSREAMTAIASDLGAQLRAVPGVRSVGGHVGRAVLSDRIHGIGTGELWVGIDPDADHGDTVAAVREVAAGYDEAPAQIRSSIADQVEAGGALMSEFDRGRVTLGEDEVVVRVYGEELQVLLDQARSIGDSLSGIEGVSRVRVDKPPVEPNLEVAVDLDAAERHGLKPGDVRRVATTLANGLEVGSLFEEQKVFDVIVNGDRDYFADPDQIGALLIDKPDGSTVRLDEVADVSFGESFSLINRESVSRRLDVVATVTGDRDDVADDIEASVAGIGFPREYHAEVISEGQNAADTRLVGAVSVVALLTGLLLLQVVIGSWRMTAAALATIAMSMLGGVLAVLVTGGEATTGTVLGFLAVLAIAVRNVLALVAAWDLARASGLPFGRELVTRAVGERSVGILLAGAAAALVLLPVTLAGARPGLEIVHPMAVVVLGGVITAVLVPLLLLPALYLRWGEEREPALLDDEAGSGSVAGAWAR